MARVERFEELIAWQKARALNRALEEAIASAKLRQNYGLRDQIARASVSIMANIAEGFDRSGTGEFEHFLSIAKGSCAEVRSHLYAAVDGGYIGQDAFAMLQAQAEEVSRIIAGLRSAVRASRTARTRP